jgi:hypothetical protein
MAPRYLRKFKVPDSLPPMTKWPNESSVKYQGTKGVRSNRQKIMVDAEYYVQLLPHPSLHQSLIGCVLS